MWVLLSLTCHIKELSLSLSLYLLVVVIKKSEGEDKAENDTKKIKIETKMSTRFVYRKWIQPQHKPTGP